MKLSDQQAFFTNIEKINQEDHIILDYYFETGADPHLAAAQLCQEMSTVQWQRVGVDEDFRPQFAAKVISLTSKKIDRSSSLYLESLLQKQTDEVLACEVSIAYPFWNFGTKIPNLLTIAAGEGAFHAPDIITIRLKDIHFPDAFLADFQGPQFGISGLRDCLGIHSRPLLFGVIKPNVGLPPKEFAEIAYLAWKGGLDVAIDDEQMNDARWSPLGERAKQLTIARKRAEDETGEKKIYLANITDEVDRLTDLHDIAVENGANAVMLNAMTVGISAVRMLRKQARVPIMSHFDLFGTMTQVPYHGIREVVFTKLQRLAGMDALIYPGFSPRMKTTLADIHATVIACLEPMGNLKNTLPIPGGSQWAGSLDALHKQLGHIDFGVIPGRAIFNHPMGPAGGAKSMRQAWEAAAANIPLESYSQSHPELLAAMRARHA